MAKKAPKAASKPRPKAKKGGNSTDPKAELAALEDAALQAKLDGGLSFSQIAQEQRITNTGARNRVLRALMRAGKTVADLPASDRTRRYGDDVAAKAYRLRKKGATVAEICQKLGVR